MKDVSWWMGWDVVDKEDEWGFCNKTKMKGEFMEDVERKERKSEFNVEDDVIGKKSEMLIHCFCWID